MVEHPINFFSHMDTDFFNLYNSELISLEIFYLEDPCV